LQKTSYLVIVSRQTLHASSSRLQYIKTKGRLGLTYGRGLEAELQAAQQLHHIRLRWGATGGLARKEGAPLFGHLQERGRRLEGGYELLHEAHLHDKALK
jgi:hypothetical protein